MKKRILITTVVILFVLSMMGCSTNQDQVKKGPITVATMIDSEGAILGNMVIALLEEDFQIIDQTEFGTPDILRQALVTNEVDLVIDYTGSGQYYHDVEDTDVWSDATLGYERTKELDKNAHNIIWLEPAQANNTEALAVTKTFSEENQITDMYDLAGYINNGGRIKLITSASFSENIKGLRGFEQEYKFSLTSDQLIVLASGNTAEMLKALYEGINDVNVSLVYGTDGALDQMDLIVLADPLSVPPVYLPTPVIQGELLEQYPEIENILKPVFQSLTIDVLRDLNAQVAFEGKSPVDVARTYLRENGFIE